MNWWALAGAVAAWVATGVMGIAHADWPFVALGGSVFGISAAHIVK